jgi:hypothetical protein
VDEFFKVDTYLFENDQLQAVAAEHGPATYACWLAMLALAKQRRNGGSFDTSISTLQVMTGDKRRRSLAVMMVEQMQQEGLIEFSCSGPLSRAPIRFQIMQWDVHQSPTTTERKRASRASTVFERGSSEVVPRQRAHAAERDSGSNVTDLSRIRRQRQETEKKNPPPPPVEPLTLEVESNEDAPPPVADDLETVRGVFDYWKERLGWGPSTKLSPKRKRRIQWALREYSKAEVKHCIDGYADDTWVDRHLHRDIALFFRDEEKFERGLLLYAKRDRPATAAVHTAADAVDLDNWGND